MLLHSFHNFSKGSAKYFKQFTQPSHSSNTAEVILHQTKFYKDEKQDF